jgi:hypothetical protein
MKHAVQGLLILTCLVSLIFSASSCSSGGGEGAPPLPVSTTTQTIVSGTVQAPGGQVAFFKKNSFRDLFVSEAYAALTGLANVPDNTIVQLARLNANASDFSVISTTSTSGGRYSFNLTALGLQPAHDLIVRVAGSGGKEMRAFVTGTLINLDPISEASFQIVSAKLTNGIVLSQFTVQELRDIRNALSLIVGLNQVSGGGTIQGAVNIITAQIDPNIQSLIDNASQAGQTSYAVGDIGNLFPLTQGNNWQYQKATASGGSSQTFSNAVTRPGVKVVNGISTLIYRESNPENTGTPQEAYLVKDSSGITVHGNDNAADVVTPLIAPYMTYRFPLGPGSVSPVMSNRRIMVNNLPFDLSITLTVEDFESVTVPAGTFNNALKIITSQSVTFAQTGETIGTGTVTNWIVSGIGFVKSVESSQGIGFNESSTSVLAAYNVDGQQSGGGPPPPPVPTRIEISTPVGSYTAIFLNQTKQLTAMAFDQSNMQFPRLTYAWQSTDPSIVEIDGNGLITGRSPGKATVTATSGGLTSNALTLTVNNGKLISLTTNDIVYDKVSQKIFASIRSDSATNPDTITVIDPATGSIGPFVPVGVQPNKLAVSQDGQFLYVGLDGVGAVRQIQLPGLVPGSIFSLGTGTLSGCTTAPLLVDDMEVLPGLPRAVAISRKYSGGCSPWHFGIAVYDNGTQRQEVTAPFQPNATLANIIEFSGSSGTLYGLDGESDGSMFSTIAVNPSGASISKGTLRPFSAIGIRVDMVFEGARIYTNDGEVLDPVTHVSLGKYLRPNQDIILTSVRPDPLLNKVFFIGRSFTTGALHLIAYDKTTNQFLGTEEIDLANDGGFCTSGLNARTQLYRWGTDGLAFRTNGCHVVLLHSTLVQ